MATSSDPVDFDEAIAAFKKLVPITKDEWEALTQEARDQAFTVAGVAHVDVVRLVWEACEQALRQGTDLADFKGAIGPILENAWNGTVADPGWRLETIFRTNVQRAYSAGRLREATQPDTVEDRPVWLFDAVLDARTTEGCEKADGTMLPAAHPWWHANYPPRHFNCRSTVITLTHEQAQSKGGLTSAPAITSAPGFGPPTGGWQPNPSDYPAALRPHLPDPPAIEPAPPINHNPGEAIPPPPPPRLFVKPELPEPNLDASRKAASIAAKKDAALFADSADAGANELAARKRLKNTSRKKLDRHDVMVKSLLPTGAPPLDSYTAARIAGFDGGKDATKALPKERVLLTDFIGSSGESYRLTVEEHIAELVRNAGVFPDQDDAHRYRDEAPVLVRIGTKLYPYRNVANAQVNAAKALGMKTVEARILDANPALAAERVTENATARGKQATRDRDHAVEVARVRSEFDRRVKRELVGRDDVVTVRVKHQPVDYAKKFAETHKEAAPSLGWGHAMHQRGLEFPLDHAAELAKRYERVDGHPLENAGLLFDKAKKAGAPTLGAYIDSLDETNSVSASDKHQANAIAAMVGHIDAIEPRGSFNLSNVDAKVGRAADVQKQFDWLAGLTDRAVSIPESTKVAFASSGRASCSSYEIYSWKGRGVTIALAAREDTGTIFHEMGHALEASDRRLGLRASAFLDARVGTEAAKRLRDLTGSKGYDVNEVATPDRFFTAYVGKQYGREPDNVDKYADAYFGNKSRQHGRDDTERTHRATEVTSMAIEQLAHPHMSHRDFEHFLFGLGQLGGY